MPVTAWKGNFFNLDLQILIKVNINTTRELFIDVAGGLKKIILIDTKLTKRLNIIASINNNTLHLYRTRDYRRYTTRYISNLLEPGLGSLLSLN